MTVQNVPRRYRIYRTRYEMTSPQRIAITRRPGQAIVIDGPARIVVQDIPDNRVVLVVFPEEGTNVRREERQ